MNMNTSIRDVTLTSGKLQVKQTTFQLSDVTGVRIEEETGGPLYSRQKDQAILLGILFVLVALYLILSLTGTKNGMGAAMVYAALVFGVGFWLLPADRVRKRRSLRHFTLLLDTPDGEKKVVSSIHKPELEDLARKIERARQHA